MDPVSIGLAFMNSQGGAALMGGVGKGVASQAPAGPSNAEAAVYGNGLDGSAWSVNFSGQQSTSQNQDKSGGVPGIGSTGSSMVPWWAWVIVAGAVLWKLKQSRR